MLRLLALLTLAPLGVTAQPQTAADSALVHDVVEALGVEAQFAAPGAAGMMGGMSGLDADAMVDSVEAAFLRDFRPALLQESLPFLRSETYARSLQRNADMRGVDGMARMLEAMQDPDATPLADSTLAARYVDAIGFMDLARQSMERMAESLSAIPAFRDQLGPDLTPEAMADSVEAAIAGLDSVYVLSARVALAETPRSDVEEAIAFYESAAGRYVLTRSTEGTLNAMIPASVALLNQMMKAFGTEDAAGPRGIKPSLGGGPPVDPSVYEVVDEEPVLVGGLEGLQGRVVYPEDARRENAEGVVLVEFVVGKTGTVEDAFCTSSLDVRLCAAALDAVYESRFKPGRVDRQPVRARYALPVRFVLLDDESDGDG